MDGKSEAIPAGAEPFALFAAWLAEAEAGEARDPNAMTLATATPDGAPSARTVLLKDHGDHLGEAGGFVFYTNAESRKGVELLANPQAALLFYWKSLNRQVRVEGTIRAVEPEVADAYFASRHRDSQAGAVASQQSRPLADRDTFLRRVAQVQAEYAGRDIERPAHWTGFLLSPERVEFWQDRDYRLHERRLFVRSADRWTDGLLYP